MLLLSTLGAASALVAHSPALKHTSAAPVSQCAGSTPAQMMLGSQMIGRALRRAPSFAKIGVGRSGGIRVAGGAESDESGLTQFASGYRGVLDSKPLLIKGLASMVAFALGDLLAQILVAAGQPFDVTRFLRFTSFGLLLHGPLSHAFYGQLDGAWPGANSRAVAVKVAVDQLVWAPLFSLLFFGYIGGLEALGSTASLTVAMQHIGYKTKANLLRAIAGSWKVWPLAHTINYRFIPSPLRVPYINSVQIGYCCFLSLVGSR